MYVNISLRGMLRGRTSANAAPCSAHCRYSNLEPRVGMELSRLLYEEGLPLNASVERAGNGALAAMSGSEGVVGSAAWLGGSILGSLGALERLAVSHAEWAEHGPRILARKCP